MPDSRAKLARVSLAQSDTPGGVQVKAAVATVACGEVPPPSLAPWVLKLLSECYRELKEI